MMYHVSFLHLVYNLSSLYLLPSIPLASNANLRALRTLVCELGEAGARSGRPLSLNPRQVAAAEWMERHELAFLNSKGRLVLNSSALNFFTTLSQPQKVQDPVDPLERSLWSLRRSLIAEGWAKSDSARDASVEMKRFNAKSEHHAYYAMLLQRIMVDDVMYTKCILFSERWFPVSNS